MDHTRPTTARNTRANELDGSYSARGLKLDSTSSWSRLAQQNQPDIWVIPKALVHRNDVENAETISGSNVTMRTTSLPAFAVPAATNMNIFSFAIGYFLQDGECECIRLVGESTL